MRKRALLECAGLPAPSLRPSRSPQHHLGLSFSFSGVCCHDPRALGGLGNRVGAAQAGALGALQVKALRSWWQVMLGIVYLGENCVPGRELCTWEDPSKPSPTPCRAINFSECLLWLCLLCFTLHEEQCRQWKGLNLAMGALKCAFGH